MLRIGRYDRRSGRHCRETARHENARWRVIARNAFPFIVRARDCGRSWRGPAYFRRSCFPRWSTVAETFVNLTARGILPHHVLDTVLRLLTGFALAAVVGVVLGILMGRSRRIEDIFLPLVSILRADPGARLCAAVSALVRARQQIGGAAGRLRLGVPDHLQHLDRREGGEGNLGALGAGDGRRRPAAVRQGDRARRAALHPRAACGSGWRRPGASWSASRCWPPCPGASAG